MSVLYHCSLIVVLQRATELVSELSAFFKRLALVRLAVKASQKTGNARHDVHWQLERRRHLALSRNRLLWAALSHAAHQNVKWVLWLDVDVRHVPRDLIRYLLSANRSIVVPNCLWKQDNGQVRVISASGAVSVAPSHRPTMTYSDV